MAYQNLTLRNIAGEITATFNDNNMRRNLPPEPAVNIRMHIQATSKSGNKNEPFQNINQELTLQEFSSESELGKVFFAAKTANPLANVSVSRIGARPYHVMVKEEIADSYEKDPLVIITPTPVQDEDSSRGIKSTLQGLKAIFTPFLEGNVVRQRVIIVAAGNQRSTIVFDSERLLRPDGDAIFNVELNLPVGKFLMSKSAFSSSTQLAVDFTDTQLQIIASQNKFIYSSLPTLDNAAALLSDVVMVDIYERSVMDLSDPLSKISIDHIQGSANEYLDHCERYVANEAAYEKLEFENIDFLYCEKCYADVEAVDLSSGLSLNEAAEWAKHKLGYFWKYQFNGLPYMTMFARKNPFDSANVSSYDHDGISYSIDANHSGVGDLLNLVEFHLHPEVSGTETSVESFANEKGLIECHVKFAADDAVSDIYGRDETAYATYIAGGWTGSGVDVLNRSQADYNLLGAFVDSGNGTDSTTGLSEAAHIAYLANGWMEVNAEGLSEEDFSLYSIAFSASLDVATPFANLSIPQAKFSGGDAEYVVRLRPSVVAGSRQISDYALNNPGRLNNDPFVMNHFDLTGELVPEAVTNRLMDFDEASTTLQAANIEVREVSFLHQAAQAAYKASTNYSQTIAIVPTTPPSASSNGISKWAGDPATYVIGSDGSVTVSKNGTGVLGTKLLAGKTDYRDGAAFGGIILTNGDNLPNGVPYGIDDQDEALDSRGNPIDLGKHVVVVGAYGFMPDPQSLFPGQKGKLLVPRGTGAGFGSAGPMIASILTNLEPGTEPIGPIRGVVPGFSPQQRTPRSVLDNLAALRVCMIDQTGVISSIYTAASRESDYTKISSILSANAILGQLRGLCNSVIGTAYRDEQIASLSQAIDGQMRAMVRQGWAQAIDVNLTASQLDRINGVLRASVTFVPPLSIEAVTIDITLQAPAA